MFCQFVNNIDLKVVALRAKVRSSSTGSQRWCGYLVPADEGSRKGTPSEDSGAIDTIRSYILVDDAQVSDWSNGSIRASG